MPKEAGEPTAQLGEKQGGGLKMSLSPMVRKCRKCRKTYPFNPDVGKGISCPYCGYFPKGMRGIRPMGGRDMLRMGKENNSGKSF